MKRAIFIFLFLLSLSFIKCEKDKCKECSLVMRDAGGMEIRRTAPEEYCGDMLKVVENQPPVESNGYTMKYECR